MPNQPRTLHDYALWYHRLSLTTIPIFPSSKRPATRWKNYQSVRPTEKMMEVWFADKTAEEVGIGIICGTVSNNLVVLDFDDPSVWQTTHHHFFSYGHFIVETGSGKHHVYLRSAAPTKKGRIDDISLDVQGEGSYVVAPPSLHPDGGEYRVLDFSGSIQHVSDAYDLGWDMARRLGFYRYKRTLRPPGRPKPFKQITLRPCIQAMISGNNGEAIGRHGLSHPARRAVCSEGFSMGLDDIQVAELFRNQSDYDLKTSIYQVRSLQKSWVGRPYSCRKIRENGWCLGELCHRFNYIK